jgi:predicted GNAT family acetyltransferase
MDVVDVAVRDLMEKHRYEARAGDDVAGHLAYHDRNGVRTLIHTIVDEAFEGRGVGSALARAALADSRARGLKVRPTCPFVAGWIERHPDYNDLVVP